MGWSPVVRRGAEVERLAVDRRYNGCIRTLAAVTRTAVLATLNPESMMERRIAVAKPQEEGRGEVGYSPVRINAPRRSLWLALGYGQKHARVP